MREPGLDTLGRGGSLFVVVRVVVGVLLAFSAVACASGRTCSDVEADAKTVLAASQHCTMDSDCIFTAVPAECLPPFLCGPVSVNANTNLEKLRADAKSLSDEHADRCNTCVQALCADSASFTPGCTDGACSWKPRQ